MLRISEIFYSIQGESSWAGRPCTFVRLAGCNLRCAYCDTRFAQEGGVEMSVENVLVRLAGFGPCPLAEVTGGEPLLQEECPQLLEGLLREGRTVLLETNGTVDISGVPEGVVRIMDVKCPGSGCSHLVRWENLSLLRPPDEVKFVLTDRRDYDWAKDVIARHGLDRRVTVLLSPAWGRLDAAELAGWVLADHLPARVQPQLHRLLWPDRDRGV